jgi:hypothetical protein
MFLRNILPLSSGLKRWYKANRLNGTTVKIQVSNFPLKNTEYQQEKYQPLVANEHQSTFVTSEDVEGWAGLLGGVLY